MKNYTRLADYMERAMADLKPFELKKKDDDVDEMCGKDHGKKKKKKKMEEGTLNEALEWITVWQGKDGEHKSSIGMSDKEPKAFVSGVIPHGAMFMFDRKEVPKIIKLLKMKDSPIVKD